MTAEAPRPTPDLPVGLHRIHIIGICGTAMAALAGMLRQRGFEVTGSDVMAYPPVSDLLKRWGIPILEGYCAHHLDDRPDLVVVGNVCRRENPEARRMMEQQIPYVSLPEALRLLFMADKRTIVVTGTHGKTTTCSLLAWLLQESRLDPSFLIGGIPVNFGSNFQLGKGPYFLVEGDEYDTAFFDKVPKFWHYPADLATLNNIEFDHADIYDSIDEIEWVFAEFAARVDPRGTLWINGDCVRSLQAARAAETRVRTFGLGEGNELSAQGVSFDKEGTRFRLVREGRVADELATPLWGEHNLRNTLGAVGVALDAGVELTAIRSALPHFRGVVKRQQVKGCERDIWVIDDFAHHPTAVKETLKALRRRFPDGRMWALFEAKSNTSRRAVFQQEYALAFDQADRVVLSQVWKKDDLPESEKLSIERLADDIRKQGKQVSLIPEVDEIVEYVGRQARPHDVIVGLSGSDFGGLHDKLLQRLKSPA